MSKEKTDNIIKTIPGLDAKKLYADMETKEIEEGLKNNFKLAQTLGVTGTPIIIFTNKDMSKFSLAPGQTGSLEGDFKQSLKEVR